MRRAYQYVDDVLAGRVLTCHWVTRAVERFVHDMDNAGSRGWIFREDYAQRHIDFFPEVLRHSKGMWKGQPFELLPWQAFIHACVYGWVAEEPTVIANPMQPGEMIERHMRRFRSVYEEEARKNGKTTRAAGVGLFHMFADYESGPEVFACATKRDQAKRTFHEATNMVKASPELQTDLQVAGPARDPYRIFDLVNNGFFIPLGRDSDTEDGHNPSCGLIDEYHAHRTSDMYDVIDSGTAARLQPIIWAITTAGFDPTSACFELRTYTTQVLDGFDKDDGIKDDTHFGIIYTLDGHDTARVTGDTDDDDAGDAWDDPAVWVKSNPSLGVTVFADDLAHKARKAGQMPRTLNNFKCKHLNLWTQSAVAWLNRRMWDRAQVPTFGIDDLRGRLLWGGLDLATSSNLCALALLAESDDGTLDLLVRYYCPQATIAEPDDTGSELFTTWAADGHIIETPGEVTDYGFIQADVMEIAESCMLDKLGFDRWNSSQLIQQLQNEGMHEQLAGFGQGYRSMNAPIIEIERRVKARTLRVSSNPVLTWQMDNVRVAQDPARNTKIDRNLSAKSVDGPVAMCMAFGMYLSSEHIEDHDGTLAVVGG